MGYYTEFNVFCYSKLIILCIDPVGMAVVTLLIMKNLWVHNRLHATFVAEISKFYTAATLLAYH